MDHSQKHLTFETSETVPFSVLYSLDGPLLPGISPSDAFFLSFILYNYRFQSLYASISYSYSLCLVPVKQIAYKMNLSFSSELLFDHYILFDFNRFGLKRISAEFVTGNFNQSF
ncbi:hypothetical protein L1049_013890 [Liquidambar formosana]|uniref:Uncharacterized protein n=1 Tax=Liquidambar formosana TaxID=63359 RepID=A0AAP0RM37_LIQFO